MSWLSDLFSPKKKEAAAVYKPYEDPSIQLAKKNLEDILSRRGYFNESEMGYTPETISATTAPYATARRANLANYELPLISSQASARGLGRSTIPVNRAALSGQEAERDINERLAQMISESEQVRANQKNVNAQAYQNAISGISSLGTQQVNAENQARINAAEALNTNRAAGNARGQQLGALIATGVGAAVGGPVGAGIGSSLFSAGSNISSKYSSQDILDTANYAKSIYGGAGVNVSGDPTSVFLRNLGQMRLPSQIGSYQGYKS